MYLTRRKGFVKLAIQGGAGIRMTQGLSVHSPQHSAQSRGILAPILMAEASISICMRGLSSTCR